jgi:predicted transcriptional regulator
MPRPSSSEKLEVQYGVPVEQLIPDLLNKLGTQKAVADHLGISQATVSTWLKDNGYVPKTVYVKQEGNENHA